MTLALVAYHLTASFAFAAIVATYVIGHYADRHDRNRNHSED